MGIPRRNNVANKRVDGNRTWQSILGSPAASEGVSRTGLKRRLGWGFVVLNRRGRSLDWSRSCGTKLVRVSAFFSWRAGASQFPGVERQTYQLTELLQPGLALKPWLLPTPRRQLSEASL